MRGDNSVKPWLDAPVFMRHNAAIGAGARHGCGLGVLAF